MLCLPFLLCIWNTLAFYNALSFVVTYLVKIFSEIRSQGFAGVMSIDVWMQ